MHKAHRQTQQPGRVCDALASELYGSAAAAEAVRKRDREHAMAVSHPPLQHQQRADSSNSLSLSDLCDLELEGLVCQMSSVTSPQHSNSGHDDCRALQGRQEEGTLACNLQVQHQLLELQRQLHLLQVQLQQQQQQQPDETGTAPPDSGKPLQADARQLAAQVEQLKHRNTRLQAALAEISLQAAQAAQSAIAAQQQAAAAQQEAALLRQQRDAVTARVVSRQAAAAAVPARGSLDGDEARGSGEQELRRLHGELLECSMRCNAAMEQNAALLLEKKQWLGRLAAAEAEAERCRAEGRDLRLSQLLASTSAGTPQQAEQQAQVQALMQQVLEAQADEAAVRGVLWEARQEQLALCSALAAELRRVHSLQSLRTGDLQKQQRLQRRIDELQGQCQQQALLTAQQQQQQQQQQHEVQAAGSADGCVMAFSPASAGGDL